jgi:hypothetical protein
MNDLFNLLEIPFGNEEPYPKGKHTAGFHAEMAI